MDQTVIVTADLKNTTFVCNATGNPQPEIQWIRNDATISTNEDYQITSFIPKDCPMFTGCEASTILIILDTEPHDEGEYTCVASNTVGSNKREVGLTVNGSNRICDMFQFNIDWLLKTVCVVFYIWCNEFKLVFFVTAQIKIG